MLPATKLSLDFASQLNYSDIPAHVVEQMKKYVFDLICCSVAGSKASEIDRIRKIFVTSSDTTGVMPFGNQVPQTPEIAAIINAASGHALEMDDSDRTGLSHPGVMVITSALIASELTNPNGKDFISACVAGYEVMLRVGTALGLDHYAIWHTTSTTGGLGASIACGKLMGLNRQQLADAFGNAGTLACGLWEFNHNYSMSKLLHAGMGVSHGILSTRLAKEGFTGADQILEGSQGMFKGFPSKDLDLKVFDDYSKFWRAANVTFKPYPCCRHTHGGIDCGLLLNKRHINPSEIKAIHIETYKAAYDVVASTQCKTTKQAKFSLPYTVITAMLDGVIKEPSFNLVSINRNETQHLLKLCDVTVAEDIQAVHPFHENCRVTVVLYDGQSFTEFVFDPLGEPENPMSWDDLIAKGRELLHFVSDADFKTLLQKVQNLENETECRTLYRVCHNLSLN